MRELPQVVKWMFDNLCDRGSVKNHINKFKNIFNQYKNTKNTMKYKFYR